MVDSPDWLNIRYRCSPHSAEELESLLLEAGACSITYTDAQDEPMFEPELGSMPLWNETTLTALFQTPSDIPSLLQSLTEDYFEKTGLGLSHASVETLENQVWERAWLEQFKPLKMGDRLWICPSWSEPPDPEAINLLLDPGLAFGTGTHPTTALCLNWLDQNLLSTKHVVDFGCGSGILGIASALLGASKVVAIDHDPQAIQATLYNAERNQVSHKIEAHLPNDVIIGSAEMVIANILAQPLIDLKNHLLSHLVPEGQIVLSGILESQERSIIEAYDSIVHFNHRVEKDGWLLLGGHKL